MRRCLSQLPSDHLKRDPSLSSKTNRYSKPSTPDSQIQKTKERHRSGEKIQSNQHLLKPSTCSKQRNIPADLSSDFNRMRYSSSDESAVVEVPVKPCSPRKQRSKSTVSDHRQPWGQLLNKHSNSENDNVFGKCDPLRTLHFLARELQTHMQNKLPEEPNIQEIINAMHSALKRIPPEVASTVQLQQQSIDLIPRLKKSSSKDSLNPQNHCDDNVEAPKPPSRQKDLSEFEKLIVASTMKLEASCKHLENMCGQLKDEKLSLETMLQSERTNFRLLQSRIEEMEVANRKLLGNLHDRDEELGQLKITIEKLQSKLNEKNAVGVEAQAAAMAELKKSKSQLERDNQKLEHQLRLCAIEKEKYLAILAVRDRQIYEIRNEMTQLQQSVNEQLVELHNYASSALPENIMAGKVPQDKINVDGGPISSIWTNGMGSDGASDQSPKNSDSEDDQPNSPQQAQGVYRVDV